MLLVIFCRPTTCPVLFQVSSVVFHAQTETFWPFWADGLFNFLRGMVLKKSLTVRQISFFVMNRFHCNDFFSCRNNQKSQGVRSDEYRDVEELRKIRSQWIWKWTCRCEAEHCCDAGSNYRANVVACDQCDTVACEVVMGKYRYFSLVSISILIPIITHFSHNCS